VTGQAERVATSSGPLAPGSAAAGVRAPVLLVHGAGSSIEHNFGRVGWTELLAEAGRPVIGYELPGHGGRPAPTQRHGEEIVDDLLATLAGYPTIDAVGFSAGAQLVAATAAREPTRFRRIALLGVGAALLNPNPAGPLRLAAALADETGEAGEADGMARIFRRMARSAGNDIAGVSGYLALPKPSVTREGLSKVTASVLIALGDRDFACPADGLAAAFPHAELRVLPGVDHFGLAADVRCLDAVLSFLDAGRLC
jgi:pimeloyl-ACP methyl ester carboxylesterase